MTTNAQERTAPAQAAEQPQEGQETQHWAVWSVYARESARSVPGPEQEQAAVREFEDLVETLGAEGVTVRGAYDVSGQRADADVMLWLHGQEPAALQEALRRMRRTELLSGTRQVWSSMGVHREAEFTANHSPSYARGVPPEAWVCVYPFVRSYEWYWMEADDRSRMLRNHGMKAREYPQVLANTIACFGLNDYEWMLALEAPELLDLVDVMRHFRNTEARLHVREETPFYTGRRVGAQDLAEVLR